MDAIYSRIQTVDSVALGLSAFTIDLNQISKAMNNATSQSLILVDEFGKGKTNLTEKRLFSWKRFCFLLGTAETDGQALLAASIDHWVQKSVNPYLFVSTHFHSLPKLLREIEARLDYSTFEYEIDQETQELVYFYKLKAGSVVHSEASQIAKNAGMSNQILQRSQTILDSFSQGVSIRLNTCMQVEMDKLIDYCDEFLNADINEDNLDEVLGKAVELMCNVK